MAFCTSCGAKNDDSSKFCNTCGKPIGGQAAPAPAAPAAPAQQVAKCPGCGAPLGSFQTKCPTCGMELNTTQGDEAVKTFFKKLEDLSQKEYEANKAREGQTGAKKKKQPKAVVLCEVVAVISALLIILHATGIRNSLLESFGVSSSTNTTSSTAYTFLGSTYVIQSGDILLSFADTGNKFAMVADDDSETTGTYSVSGNSVTLTISGGDKMRLTIVNETTLRDDDGDTWKLRQ